jgi:hypothetical protein
MRTKGLIMQDDQYNEWPHLTGETRVPDGWNYNMDEAPRDGRRLALLTKYTWYEGKVEFHHDHGYWTKFNKGETKGHWVHNVLGKIVAWADVYPALPNPPAESAKG